jgi:hypothetical protein
MIRFRPLIRSREARRIIARELRAARTYRSQMRHYSSLRMLLLNAKASVHFDKVNFDIRARVAAPHERGGYQCRARWSEMAEDALARAYASLDPGSIPLPSGFTFLMDSD